MRLTIAYSKIQKKRNLVLNNNATRQRETLTEWPIRLPLMSLLRSVYSPLWKTEQNKTKNKTNKTKQKQQQQQLLSCYFGDVCENTPYNLLKMHKSLRIFTFNWMNLSLLLIYWNPVAGFEILRLLWSKHWYR